jgi:hypothetical protein
VVDLGFSPTTTPPATPFFGLEITLCIQEEDLRRNRNSQSH